MSLRHWEATRDRLRDELDEHLMTAGATSEQKDQLAGVLATASIDAYTKSVYKDFKPEPVAQRSTGRPGRIGL